MLHPSCSKASIKPSPPPHPKRLESSTKMLPTSQTPSRGLQQRWLDSPLVSVPVVVASHTLPHHSKQSKPTPRRMTALVQYITENAARTSAIGFGTIYPVLSVCLVFLKTFITEGWITPPTSLIGTPPSSSPPLSNNTSRHNPFRWRQCHAMG